MELAPAAVPLSFEVTFDSPSLYVAMSVYDTTTGSPTLISGPTAMQVLVGNTYFGRFTAAAGRAYVIFKAVYTDGTFTVLRTDYAQGTESIFAMEFPSPEDIPSNCPIIGLVQNPSPVIGLVDC
jgi:hypothetical protein